MRRHSSPRPVRLTPHSQRLNVLTDLPSFQLNAVVSIVWLASAPCAQRSSTNHRPGVFVDICTQKCAPPLAEPAYAVSLLSELAHASVAASQIASFYSLKLTLAARRASASARFTRCATSAYDIAYNLPFRELTKALEGRSGERDTTVVEPEQLLNLWNVPPCRCWYRAAATDCEERCSQRP